LFKAINDEATVASAGAWLMAKERKKRGGGKGEGKIAHSSPVFFPWNIRKRGRGRGRAVSLSTTTKKKPSFRVAPFVQGDEAWSISRKGRGKGG